MAFVERVKLSSSLTSLDLRSNKLDDECGVAIGGYLHRRTRLSTLLLSDNDLGEAAGKAIAKAWGESQTLCSLDIRANRLNSDAVKALKTARGSAAKKQAGSGVPVELLVDE